MTTKFTLAVAMLSLVIGTAWAGAPCQQNDGTGRCETSTITCGNACESNDCNTSGTGTLTLTLGPTTCQSAGTTDCPTSGCSTGDSISGKATITVSGGGATDVRKFAICEAWVSCTTGTAAATKCSVVTIVGNNSANSTITAQPGSGSWQHIVTSYEVPLTGQCSTCNTACSNTIPPTPPTGCSQCDSATYALAASCCIPLP